MEHLLKISEITVQYKPAKANKPKIISSSEALSIIRCFFQEDTIDLQEQFVAMYLNRANRVIGVYKVSMGGITGTVADPRLILSVALKSAATSIILAHNHPSGNLKPSKADIDLTMKIKAAAVLMDITVLDHLIITSDEGFLSFADEGLI